FSKTLTVLTSEDVLSSINEAFDKILHQLEELHKLGSGWVVSKITKCDIHVGKYKAMRGGCNVTLDKYLTDKHAIVDVKCEDNKCFLYSILACLHPPEKNPNRETHYLKYVNELNLEGINFPAKIS